MKSVTFVGLLAIAICSNAQTTRLPTSAADGRGPVVSPEVHQDHSVTFRLRDPNAKLVMLSREGAKASAMQRDGNGVWSVTTEPLKPDYYGYSFVADGVGLVDPGNSLIKPNLLGLSSMVHVPGPSSLPWEENDVPHGQVHRHFYHSAIVGDDRDFYVYTPPDYDARATARYPVLYLLHGFSDDASGWIAVGRANVILDNLIARQKAKPMLIVMPLGYGAPEIVARAAPRHDPSLREKNITRFRDALFNEVMPQVQKAYQTDADGGSRAIVGLSMGGAESLFVGLNAADRFSWIGSFSGGGFPDDLETTFPHVGANLNSQLKLLWIACGTDDGLLVSNRKTCRWLKGKGMTLTEIETPGAHTWMVWRRNLAAFVPLLFR